MGGLLVILDTIKLRTIKNKNNSPRRVKEFLLPILTQH